MQTAIKKAFDIKWIREGLNTPPKKN